MADLVFATPPAVCPVCGSKILQHAVFGSRSYGCGLELFGRSTWSSVYGEPNNLTWFVSRQCGEAMERAMVLREQVDAALEYRDASRSDTRVVGGEWIDAQIARDKLFSALDSLRAASAETAGEK